MKKNGFTLIELVIVIIILSILAAVALPRFIGLEEQAEDAVLLSALGSLRSAARIGESQGVVAGFNGTGLLTINNRDIYFYNGFPVARANDIGTTGPGEFDGILYLLEIEGAFDIHYSDSTQIVSRQFVTDDTLIIAVNQKCISYRPPQTDGELPEYSDGVLTYDQLTNTCR